MQPFRKLTSSRIYLLSLIEVLLVIGSYYAAIYLYAPDEASVYLWYDQGAQQIGVVALQFLLISYLFDSYKQITVSSRTVLVLQLAFLIGILFIMQAVFVFIRLDLTPPQPIVLIGNVLTLTVLTIWRVFCRPVAWNVIGPQRILFVGSGEAVRELARVIDEQPALGMELEGFVVDPQTAGSLRPVLGAYDRLIKVASETKPDRVIVSDDIQDRAVLNALFEMRSAGLTVESSADAYEIIFGRVYSRSVEPYTVIFRNELSAPPGSIALQSIYNNLLAVAAVILLLPVMAVIGLLLKLTRRGPVLGKYLCVGLHGQPFKMYRLNCDGQDALSAFLLKYKIEAIPQILNIFRGEMSLIGPRAERAEFSRVIDELIPFYRQRYSVKPGVVGWSQLHCDTRDTEDTLTRVEYDLYYLKHISLLLDAYILLRGLKWILSERQTDNTKRAELSVVG